MSFRVCSEREKETKTEREQTDGDVNPTHAAPDSQNVRDDSYGPAVHRLAVRFLSQDLRSCQTQQFSTVFISPIRLLHITAPTRKTA